MKNITGFLVLILFSAGLFAQDTKSPLPSADDIKSAMTTVKDVFKDEYKNLKTTDDRKALAKKLLEQAADPANSPATVYAIISESAKFASEVADISLLIEGTNLLASRFKGEGVRQERYRLLKSVENTKAKLPAESLSTLAEAYLNMAEELTADDEFNDALMLARDAERIAKKAKNTELLSKVGELKKDIPERLRSMKEVSAAIEKLKANPDDPDANFAVGKYTCFSKGDWDKGLPMLVKCSDKDYKETAELDLAAKDTASTMLSADKWWNLADKEKSKTAKSAIMSHAAEKYKKIIGELGGIEKTKAEKRAKESSESMILKSGSSRKSDAGSGAEVEVICLSGSLIKVGIIKPGEMFNTNRTYKFGEKIDKALLNLQFIKFPHNDRSNNLDFIVNKSGCLYIFTNPKIEIGSDLEKNGFKKTNLLAPTSGISDNSFSSWIVFQKEVDEGDKYSFAGSAWITPIVVGKKVKIKTK